MARVFASILTAILVSLMLFTSSALATSSDWMNTTLWIDDDEISSQTSESCTEKNIHFLSDAYSGDRSLCVMGNEGLSLGRLYYIDRDNVVITSVVNLDGGDTMYPVTPDIFNPYSSSDSWFIASGTDDAIYLHRDSFDGGFQLYRYNNLPSKFHQTSESDYLREYSFDKGDYDFHLTRPNGQAINVSNFTASSNGEWAVMEADGIGLITMNLQTDAVRRVLPMSVGDWQEADASGLAISNDGEYLARFSPGGQAILAIGSGCGDLITDDVIDTSPVVWSCRSRDVSESLGDYGNSTRYDNLLFDDEMQWLDFDAGDIATPTFARMSTSTTESKSGRARLTTIKPTQPLKYLALGDSYSSGEGTVGGYTYTGSHYIGGTGGDSGCHLSNQSYPFLLRNKWEIDISDMQSVACSGAQVAADYLQHNSYLGQHRELVKLAESVKEDRRYDALNYFKPGIVPQIEFVKKYRPYVVTFTGGGNDVGFADMLKYCAYGAPLGNKPSIWEKIEEGVYGLTTCDYAKSDSQLQGMVLDQISDQYGITLRLLQQIKLASPDTEIVVVGYPSFVSPDAIACANSLELNAKERGAIDYFLRNLNYQLRRAADDSGYASYADTYGSLVGGRMCEGSEYVSGPINNTNNLSGWFHPNTAGHERIADAIYNNVELPNLSEPEKPDYIGDAFDGIVRAYQLVRDAIIYAGKWVELFVPSGTFGPGSSVSVTLHSDPIDLGHINADSDGGIDTKIHIPDNLGAGFHILMLEGRNESGEAVIVYQHVIANPPSNYDSGEDSQGADGSITPGANIKVDSRSVEVDDAPTDVGVSYSDERPFGGSTHNKMPQNSLETADDGGRGIQASWYYLIGVMLVMVIGSSYMFIYKGGKKK